jgi:hypothetical protein
MNAYDIETGPKADAQLEKLDAAIGASVEWKFFGWLKMPRRCCIGGWLECRRN